MVHTVIPISKLIKTFLDPKCEPELSERQHSLLVSIKCKWQYSQNCDFKTKSALDVNKLCQQHTRGSLFKHAHIRLLEYHNFHRTYATGAAWPQRTLTPPDTWSCPTLGLACVLMSDETNLSWTCLVSGLLSFEHPSVLLFCFYKLM